MLFLRIPRERRVSEFDAIAGDRATSHRASSPIRITVSYKRKRRRRLEQNTLACVVLNVFNNSKCRIHMRCLGRMHKLTERLYGKANFRSGDCEIDQETNQSLYAWGSGHKQSSEAESWCGDIMQLSSWLVSFPFCSMGVSNGLAPANPISEMSSRAYLHWLR